MPLVKIPGEINTADFMTKHLWGSVLLKHVKNLNLEIREGRSEQAAKLSIFDPGDPDGSTVLRSQSPSWRFSGRARGTRTVG